MVSIKAFTCVESLVGPTLLRIIR